MINAAKTAGAITAGIFTVVTYFLKIQAICWIYASAISARKWTKTPSSECVVKSPADILSTGVYVASVIKSYQGVSKIR